MIILNPGSLHSASNGVAALDMADYIDPADAVATISNNPSAVTS